MFPAYSPTDLEYRSDSESVASHKSAATSITSISNETSDSERPAFAGYARFAPNAVPIEVPNIKEQQAKWEKIVSRDGIPYFYNWFTGEVRFDDYNPDQEEEQNENEDPLVKRADQKNPHLKSLRRPQEARALQEQTMNDENGAAEEPDTRSILQVPKYRGGRGGWRAVFDRTTKVSHWEDKKGRKLANDLPRWFGPITLHV